MLSQNVNACLGFRISGKYIFHATHFEIQNGGHKDPRVHNHHFSTRATITNVYCYCLLIHLNSQDTYYSLTKLEQYIL